MAVAAAADLVSRILLVVVSFFVQIKARYIYLTSVIGGIITRLGMHLNRLITNSISPKSKFYSHIFSRIFGGKRLFWYSYGHCINRILSIGCAHIHTNCDS